MDELRSKRKAVKGSKEELVSIVKRKPVRELYKLEQWCPTVDFADTIYTPNLDMRIT